MKCPIDNTPLIIKSQEGLVSNGCPNCKSILLNSKGIRAFKHNFGSKVLEQLINQKQQEPSNLNCSHCKNQMFLRRLGSIELDICTNCKSIWFDQNEVSQLISKYRSSHSDFQSFGGDTIVANFLPLPMALLYYFINWFMSNGPLNSNTKIQKLSELNKHQEQSLINKNREQL